MASEKLALYPGWSVTVDGKPVDIVRDNGILGAVRVGAGDTVRLSYEPRYFRSGVALLGAMLFSVALMERFVPETREP